MTMPMNLNPQYITDKDGNKISVILPIEEFNSIMDDDTINSLSHLENHIIDGLNSQIIEQSHKEIFQELKTKYA